MNLRIFTQKTSECDRWRQTGKENEKERRNALNVERVPYV